MINIIALHREFKINAMYNAGIKDRYPAAKYANQPKIYAVFAMYNKNFAENWLSNVQIGMAKNILHAANKLPNKDTVTTDHTIDFIYNEKNVSPQIPHPIKKINNHEEIYRSVIGICNIRIRNVCNIQCELDIYHNDS